MYDEVGVVGLIFVKHSEDLGGFKSFLHEWVYRFWDGVNSFLVGVNK